MSTKKEINPANMQKLTIELIEFLQKRELFHDVNIYSNNIRFSTDKTTDSITAETKFGPYYITENCDVTKIIEYNNTETITVTFEGPLNHELNYGSGKTEKALSKLLAKYNLYFEQGYAWSLAAYQL